ncbi:MAG: tetratricopeptide repeat protein [Promethearchaeota archaeon]
MVAIMRNDLFEQAKSFFKEKKISDALDAFEKAMSAINRANENEKTKYIEYLNELLRYCRENGSYEQEALVLRNLGRIHSIFKNYAESMKYHYKALKIQRKYGKKLDVAEGLVFLAEELEISGNYSECIKAYTDAEKLFKELGKLRKAKEIAKEIKRLESFSKEIIEDEYYLSKFNIKDF